MKKEEKIKIDFSLAKEYFEEKVGILKSTLLYWIIFIIILTVFLLILITYIGYSRSII